MKINDTLIGFRVSTYLKVDLKAIADEYGLSLTDLITDLLWLNLTTNKSHAVLKDDAARRLKLMLSARCHLIPRKGKWKHEA